MVILRSFASLALLSLLAPQEGTEHEAARKKLKLAAGLEASLWASNPHLANPVAISLDEKGRISAVSCG